MPTSFNSPYLNNKDDQNPDAGDDIEKYPHDKVVDRTLRKELVKKKIQMFFFFFASHRTQKPDGHFKVWSTIRLFQGALPPTQIELPVFVFIVVVCCSSCIINCL